MQERNRGTLPWAPAVFIFTWLGHILWLVLLKPTKDIELLDPLLLGTCCRSPADWLLTLVTHMGAGS